MTTDALVAFIVGSLLPLIVSVVVRSSWPSWLKGLAALGSSLLAGVVTAWAQGELTNVKGLAQAIVIVFGASMATYKFFWAPTGIGAAIERATQPTYPQQPKKTVSLRMPDPTQVKVIHASIKNGRGQA